MGTTTANWAVKQLPYGLLRNVNQNLQPVSVVILDSNGNARADAIHRWSLNSAAGIPFYTGETIVLAYRGGNQSSSAQVCDLWRVNPSTGAETFQSSVALTAQLQKVVSIKVTAINAGSGALTTSVSYTASTYGV